jgi:ABC-type glycerol-3-phosphate transport system substrate-binding protein
MKGFSRKGKKWVVFGSVALLAIGGILVWRLVQPANQLDFSTSENFWENEKVASATTSVKTELVPTNAVFIENPLDSSEQVVEALSDTTSTFTVNVPEEGDYSLVFSFYNPTNGLSDTNFSLEINDVEAASKIAIRSLWQNASEDFEVDRNGNDVMPTQNQVKAFTETPLRDYLNGQSYPLTFAFEAGVSTLGLTMTEGDILIGDSYLESPCPRLSYADYSILHSEASAYEGAAISLEAEKPYCKDDNSIVYEASKDVNCTPYDTYKLKLNTATMSKCDADQELTYQFDAPSDGFYLIAVNYLNEIANRADFVRVAIDGEIPFGEVANYPLYSNSVYEMKALGETSGDKEPYKFYLSQGTHTVSIALDGTMYDDITDELNGICDSISALYLQLRTLSVQSGDESREWTPNEDFPGVVEELEGFSTTLKGLYQEVKERNGSSILNEGNVYLSNAYTSLDALLKEPQYLPNNSDELAEGSGSIQQAIASASSYLLDGTLSLDKVVIAALDDDSIYQTKSGFYRFWEGVKSFFGSFASGTAYTDSDALDVWVNRPTMYIDLMQNLVDTTFTADTGVKVNFERLSDEGKLILSAAAGSTPDAVLGLSNWLPYELGIRSLSQDLREFSDYDSVISRFAPGALLPLVADDIGLGLPETQDFYVTYYRKDIFQNAGLSVPETWQEVMDLLPTLQRKGMNYYIPLSTSTSSKALATTAPFLEQCGASLWDENSDGSIVTGIDSEAGLSAMKMMTNFYLLYGMELQVNSFFNSFRNGSLPIGVAPMETYQKLQYAAPELSGKWDIALSPGIAQDDGTIARWQAGSATSCLMMKNTKDKEDCWSFLKWWDSAETQSSFANSLRNLVGTEYIYIPANLEAFDDLSLPTAHKNIIKQQWEWMAEYPRVPGWYMLERELSNAWNNIVLDGENFRTAVDDSVSLINKEIKRKMIQFGYLAKDGSLIKNYKFSTLEEITRWQNQ